MHKYPSWKYWLIALVLVVSIMGSLPNIMQVPSWWPDAMSKPMSLGLDLKGGVHLVLDVDVDKAVEHSVEEDISLVRQELRKAKLRYQKLAAKQSSIEVSLKRKEDVSAAEQLLAKALPSYGISRQGESGLRLDLKPDVVSEIQKFAIDQAIEVIRSRIDALGTTEPVIVKQGERRILVQIPGYEDTAHAKELIGRTAQLEFKLVDEKGDLQKALNGQIPPGDIIMYGPKETRNGRT